MDECQAPEIKRRKSGNGYITPGRARPSARSSAHKGARPESAAVQRRGKFGMFTFYPNRPYLSSENAIGLTEAIWLDVALKNSAAKGRTKALHRHIPGIEGILAAPASERRRLAVIRRPDIGELQALPRT